MSINDINTSSKDLPEGDKQDNLFPSKRSSPFQMYEVVEIHPLDLEIEPDVVNLIGRRGIVSDIGYNESTCHWDVYVTLQNGEDWYFEDRELKGLGLFLDKQAIVDETKEAYAIRVRVDSTTGKGTVISGDITQMGRKPKPLTVDLEKL